MPGQIIDIVATLAVALCWPLYLWLFLPGSRDPSVPTHRDLRSTLGMVLQFSGTAVVLVFRRALFSSLPRIGIPLEIVAPIMAVILAAGAVWFSWLARRELGSQWRFAASIGDGHKLIQSGPYAIIRHPLYVCFFALTVATGIVWTDPGVLPLALVLFAIGGWIRVKTEENFLRQTFGVDFDRYAMSVPAFLPRFKD